MAQIVKCVKCNYPRESYVREHGQKNPCHRCKKARRVEREFNISWNTFLEMLARQGGRCAICRDRLAFPLEGGQASRKPAIDHDRNCCPGNKSCGKCVRELLCQRCNVTLGKVGDSVGLLNRLESYLHKHQPGSDREHAL